MQLFYSAESQAMTATAEHNAVE